MGPHGSKAIWDFAKVCLESGSGLGFRLGLWGWRDLSLGNRGLGFRV